MVSGNADLSVVVGCSGTFIGPQVVLTAAHCLYNSELGGWSAAAVVAPGKDGDYEPFGTSLASYAWVPDAWRSSFDNNWDWGLLKLPTSLGNTVGWFQIGVLSTTTLSDAHFQPVIGGYPADKQFGTQWASSKESFLSVDNFTLYTDIDAYPGQSGSAVWRHRDGVIVGVLVRETNSRNEASRIDSQFLNSLLAGCGAMKCTFSYAIEEKPETGPPPGPSGTHPIFDSLSPAPFSTVEPGTVRVAATAHSDSQIVSVGLTINQQDFTSTTNSVSAEISLSPHDWRRSRWTERSRAEETKSRAIRVRRPSPLKGQNKWAGVTEKANPPRLDPGGFCWGEEEWELGNWVVIVSTVPRVAICTVGLERKARLNNL